MSDQDIVDTIAAHRGRHVNNGVDLWTECRCGAGRFYDPADHSSHVLTALRSAGYEVVPKGPCLCGHRQSSHKDLHDDWTACYRCGCLGYTAEKAEEK